MAENMPVVDDSLVLHVLMRTVTIGCNLTQLMKQFYPTWFELRRVKEPTESFPTYTQKVMVFAKRLVPAVLEIFRNIKYGWGISQNFFCSTSSGMCGQNRSFRSSNNSNSKEMDVI